MDRDRNYTNRDRREARDRYDQDERDFGDRAGDEVRSWFGDDEAERRRRMDRMEAEREERRNRGRYNDDAGYGRPGRDRSQGWEAGQPDYGRRDPYGDYGDMSRSGTGWAGRSGERYAGGAFGGGYGTTAGGRYGTDPSGSFERGSRPDYGFSDRPQGADRWGASDWSEQSARSERNIGGRFAGRGPAGYQRAADRIMEDANEALTWAGDVDASQIQVKVEGAEVTLEGSVDSRRAKRAAEDAVERVRGVTDVHNRLRVQSQEDSESSTQRRDDVGLRDA